MTYIVLARKWRPRRFEEIVGQTAIVKALQNALHQQRLHHTYLFTGTRGVGKTTLARLLAKCLNCESGPTATPCDTCTSCASIDQGNSLDLLEIDAASRTKVEDTRTLLDNVPYAPANSRFKIYLIDEVHMLSGHSFNALLKTLEEPPAHVKFLLATTDPQKLPNTILSRCLQLHLKPINASQISQHMANVLQQEKFTFETSALARIARAAQGSMRDALSLLDQAIALCGDHINDAAVLEMLGELEPQGILSLARTVLAGDANVVLNTLNTLTEQLPDPAQVLEQLLLLLHQIALVQSAPGISFGLSFEKSTLQELAALSHPEEIQLLYQIALIGRRDLPLAPTPRIGLEMVLLRMLAFKPESAEATQPIIPPKVATPAEKPKQTEAKSYLEFCQQVSANGLIKTVLEHCALQQQTASEIHLQIDPKQKLLLNDKIEKQLESLMQQYFQAPLKLILTVGHEELPTIAKQKHQTAQKNLDKAKHSLAQDAGILQLQNVFAAQVLEDTIVSKE